MGWFFKPWFSIFFLGKTGSNNGNQPNLWYFVVILCFFLRLDSGDFYQGGSAELFNFQ